MEEEWKILRDEVDAARDLVEEYLNISDLLCKRREQSGEQMNIDDIYKEMLRSRANGPF